MRKLVLKMSVSVDGFVGGPGGEIDWLLKTLDQSTASWIEATLWEAGVHIMGSRTFHDMASYWPTSSNPLAAPMNEIPKVVFSKKGYLDYSHEENSTQAVRDARNRDNGRGAKAGVATSAAGTWMNVPIASGYLADEISRLKHQDGKMILAHGGASFAQDLVRHALVDEYRLVVHPVCLGKGLPLFSGLVAPQDLRLTSSVALKNGIVANVYEKYRAVSN